MPTVGRRARARLPSQSARRRLAQERQPGDRLRHTNVAGALSLLSLSVRLGTSSASATTGSADERSPQPRLLSRHSSVRSRDHEAETWCRLIWLDAVDLELSGRVHRCPVIAQVIADADALNVLKSLVSESHGLNLGRRLAGHLVLEAAWRGVGDAELRLVDIHPVSVPCREPERTSSAAWRAATLARQSWPRGGRLCRPGGRGYMSRPGAQLAFPWAWAMRVSCAMKV